MIACNVAVMAGRRAGGAVRNGRGRAQHTKGPVAGSKRKAQDVFCTAHKNDNAAHPEHTTKSLRLSFQLEVGFEVAQTL